MPGRRPTQLPDTSPALTGEHPYMSSKTDLTAEDWAVVERNAEALDIRLFGTPVEQTMDEQAAEIGITIKRIFAQSPD